MMSDPTIVLLPGLDGTGDLFLPLLNVIPACLPRRVVAYPSDRPLSYAELGSLLDGQLRAERDVALVAESFSGPLALRYAASQPDRVRAVVLCASFIRSPLPRWLRFMATPHLFQFPLPNFALKRLMVGRGASDLLLRAVKESIRKVPPRVMARRLLEVFNVDCSESLRQCAAPLLYLAAGGDAFVRRACFETIQTIRPDVEMRVVDGPHLLLQAEPKAAWQEISRFLNQISMEGNGDDHS